jgi:hypothetical protein
MARAINQTIAWIAAFFLSLIVFGIGLAIVFSTKPKHQADYSNSDESGMAPAHDAHGSESRSLDHPADSEADYAKPKIEHEDPHAKGGHEDDQEITPASVKAKADGHSQEAHPQH